MAKNNDLFELTDAGFNLGVNVRVTKRDKRTGRVLETREGHNRCLKMQLMGIIKWLNGEFNDTQPFLLHYDWIPRYLGVGTNIASGGSASVTSEVTVNDTQLLNEISPRMKLPDRNKIVNRATQSYIQLIIVTYLPEHDYIGETIGEAGLFSKESGNNCLFRITFDPIVKEQDTVVEVNWTISVISLESTGKPYDEIDKVDLRQAMNHLLDKFTTLLAAGTTVDISTINEHFQAGIYDYGRSDISQIEVDQRTMQLTDDYNNLP